MITLFVYAPIDHISGAVIIFLMAFTLIPLFAFFVTSLFSGKEYKIKHYIIAVAVYMVSQLIFKATVSHFIIQLINPDQVAYAALGLEAYGHNYASPMAAYMSHFLDRGRTQDIPFFENYYMSIEHISDALSVIVLSAYALIFRKDKYTAFGSLVLNLLTAVTTTVFTPLVSYQFDSGFFKGVEFSETFRRFASWGTWEFVTGFFIGLFVMAFLAITAGKNRENEECDMSPVKFAKIALSSYLGMCFTVYFFFDNVGIRYIKEDITVQIMLVASALIAAIYIPLRVAQKRCE